MEGNWIRPQPVEPPVEIELKLTRQEAKDLYTFAYFHFPGNSKLSYDLIAKFKYMGIEHSNNDTDYKKI